ncbi:MAG: hypothetical protein WCP10_08290 [Desulfuromonadales bacterium]
MVATKADIKKDSKTKFILGARPPQRLSKEDRELLLNLKPSVKTQSRLAHLPPLKIVDGATCGF